MDLDKLDKEIVSVTEVLSKNIKEVSIVGWVNSTRELGKIKFLLLKDQTGLIQITAVRGKTDDKIFDMIDKITRESVIYVKGQVKDSKQAPGGKEIIPEKIEIFNSAETLPIDVSEFSKTDLPKRLDNRFLDLHREKIQAIFKIQSEIAFRFREFFHNKGFFEVQLPSIISAASEGERNCLK